MGCLKTQNFNSVRIPNRRIGFWGTKPLQLSHLICCLDICFFQHWDEIFVLAGTGCHQQQLTKTQKKTKQHPNLSQTCSNAPEATQGKQASLWPPEAYFLEGFQIYNLEKHTSQLGFAHFIQPQTIPTKWYVKSTTSACELARVSNMARTRASLRWNVSPMAFSSCSTSWFSSCWFWIQKNQHFLP